MSGYFRYFQSKNKTRKESCRNKKNRKNTTCKNYVKEKCKLNPDCCLVNGSKEQTSINGSGSIPIKSPSVEENEDETENENERKRLIEELKPLMPKSCFL